MIGEHIIVEVVLKKKMTYEKYKAMIRDSKKKGWDIKAYQEGVFSEGCKSELEVEEE